MTEAHAEVGTELLREHFSRGLSHLLLDEPYQGLEAYLQGVRVCLASDSCLLEGVLEEEIESLSRGRVTSVSLPGFDWVWRLLWVAQRAEAPRGALPAELEQLASKGHRFAGPVVVVAGSCAAEEEGMGRYVDLLSRALEGFTGEVVSGGTTSGISGVVGELAGRGHEFTALGYLPGLLPVDVKADDRYHHHLTTKGEDFSPLEPMQMWVDLVVSGIETRDVKVIGIGGGPIAAVEYRTALALGAEVAVIEGSGREVDKLLEDNNWLAEGNPLALPPDPMTLWRFVDRQERRLTKKQREAAGEAAHE
jgi:hypothetical protein